MTEESDEQLLRRMVAAGDEWALEASKRQAPNGEFREQLPGVPEAYIVGEWDNGKFKGYYLGLWQAVQ